MEELIGRTTTAAARLAPAARSGIDDDTSPLLTRRQWLGCAWGAFTAASLVASASTGRMFFPNVLNEPPQQFKAGFPDDYQMGVDERWKDKFARNSSVRATAAGSASPGSTSKGRRRVPWNGPGSCSPTMGRSWSTRAGSSSSSSVSGRTPSPF